MICPGMIGILLSTLGVQPEFGAGEKPNIVVVITDDQGYGDIGAHGNPVLKTPNLDRLRARSVRFTNFLVSPTCAPTRAALMTGRHEFKSGVTHTIQERERLALSAVTLPQVLKTGGYTTGIFGKWHLGDEDAYLPEKRGFDTVCIHGAGGIGQTYAGSCGDAPGNRYTDPVLWEDGAFKREKGYCTDIFFDKGMRWMEEVGGKKPFLCWIATNAPHAPLQVRPEDEARYAGKVTQDQAKFFGMVANIDDNMGRLANFLREKGLEKNTLVIFLTDNGGTVGVPVFNDGMRGSKGTVWRGGTRGCSFWSWPGVFPAGDVSRLTAHIDFLPTLAELGRVDLATVPGAKVEGKSLVPLLRDPQANWENRLLVSHLGRWPKGKAQDYARRVTSVRDEQWKLIQDRADRDAPWQLYDLKQDPGETRDVADQHPEKVKEFARFHADWWASVIPCLVNEDAVQPVENAFKTRFQKQFGKKEPASR